MKKCKKNLYNNSINKCKKNYFSNWILCELGFARVYDCWSMKWYEDFIRKNVAKWSSWSFWARAQLITFTIGTVSEKLTYIIKDIDGLGQPGKFNHIKWIIASTMITLSVVHWNNN